MDHTDKIKASLKPAKTIEELQERIIDSLEQIKKEQDKLGYVIGILTSDGPDRIKENVEKLKSYTRKVSSENDFPIFSAMVTFVGDNGDVVDHVRNRHYEFQHWLTLWRNVLESGHITDLFVTPGWERSKGATDEHETAKRLGLEIHYLEFEETSGD